MEIDADLLALGLILQFISTHSSGTLFLYAGDEMNDPHTFGEAIAIVIRLLEQWRRVVAKSKYNPTETVHPHPDVRYVFFTAWLMALDRDKDRDEGFIEYAKLFQKGFDSVNPRWKCSVVNFSQCLSICKNKAGTSIWRNTNNYSWIWMNTCGHS